MLRRPVVVLLVLTALSACADHRTLTEPVADLPEADALRLAASLAAASDPRAFDHFVHDATGHAWANSYLLALLSHFVYVPLVGASGDADFLDTFADHFSPLGLGGFRMFEEPQTDTEVVLAESAEALFVVFRGTEADLANFDIELRDVVVDLMLVMTDGIHEGFRGSASRLLANIAAEISATPGKTVWLTGHSLGGALATVTAHLLREQYGINVAGVYTYGSPRVFSEERAAAFDAAFGARSQRWVNNRDPVPHMPFTIPPIAYQHVRVLNNIVAEDGECAVRRNDSEIELISAADWIQIFAIFAQHGIGGFGQIVDIILGLADIGDHDTGRYAARIFARMPADLRAVLPQPPYPADAATTCDEPRDVTPPVITPTVSGTLGNAGWYTSNVAITWSVVDAESAVTSTTGCGAASVTADTDGTTFTCTATSEGGTSSESVTIRRDATPPTAVAAVPSRAADHDGWYNAPFGVAWTGTDAASGVAACTTTNYAGPDTGDGTLNGTCTDVAGNTSAAVGFAFRYDVTPPVITITSPAAGVPDYFRGQAVDAAYTCADATAGVASCTGSAANGTPLPTAEFGAHELTVTATDAAGNIAQASRGYTVTYGFDGFFAPVENLPAANLARAGQSIPFKWALRDAAGDPVADSAHLFEVAWSDAFMCAAGSAVIELTSESAESSTGLRWDAAAQQYVFTVRTNRADAGTCRYLGVSVGPHAQARALVQFR